MNTGTHNRKQFNMPARIKAINLLLTSINSYRLDLAYLLQDTNQNTYWKTTKWGSFSHFCTTEINMSNGSISSYLTMVNKADRLGYTSIELRRFLKDIAWSQLLYLIAHANGKNTIKEVVSMKANHQLDYNSKHAVLGESLFRFGLPDDYALKYTGILVSHGVVLHGRHRKNVREAMMSFLDTQP